MSDSCVYCGENHPLEWCTAGNGGGGYVVYGRWRLAGSPGNPPTLEDGRFTEGPTHHPKDMPFDEQMALNRKLNELARGK